MITNYSGEFLISSIPLELSMNYCSHSCAYCFANLNNPDRSFDFKAFTKQITSANTRKDLASWFIKNKYPVLISNKVDPFATSNRYQTLAVTEILLQNGNPIAWQTKGGDAVVISQVLDLIGNASHHWYISISFWNDELRKKIEPGAPSIQDRLDLIEYLLSKNQKVSIGLNPLIEDWFNLFDLKNFIDFCQKNNINDIWAEYLHLNHKQEANLSAKEKENLTQEIIDISKKRIITRFTNYHQEVVGILQDKGFNTYSMMQPYKSNYHKNIDLCYPNKTLPTLQGFLNWCFENVPDGEFVYFGEYLDYFEDRFPAELWNNKFSDVDGYLYTHQRNLHKRWQTETGQNRIRIFKDLLTIFWNNADSHRSIFGIPNFQIVLEVDKKNKHLKKVIDDIHHLPVARFSLTAQEDSIYYLDSE